MHYKTNRLNHDFQIVHFIAGSCHTPDGAYAILCDLKEDRSNAIKAFEASKLRDQAARIRAEKLIASEDEIDRLEGKAKIADLDAMVDTCQKNYLAAMAELSTIENCIAMLQPHRKFKHLTDPEAFEAAQFEEWKLELIRRAENCLLTTGTISTDQFALMRLHPAFVADIVPAINEIRRLLEQPNGVTQILEINDRRQTNFRQMLESSTTNSR